MRLRAQIPEHGTGSPHATAPARRASRLAMLMMAAGATAAACAGGGSASDSNASTLVTAPASSAAPAAAAPAPELPAAPEESRAPVTTADTASASTAAPAAATTTDAPAPAVVSTTSAPVETIAPTTEPVTTPVTEPPTTLPLITLQTVPAPLPTLPDAPPPPTTTIAPTAAGGGGGGGGGGNRPAGRLGRLSIPKLGISAGLQSGIDLPTLDRGPGHWPGTAFPGQPGNVVIAGHRTSHGAIFRNIDNLGPGDQIVFENANGRFVYKVTGTQIVNPDAMWIIGQGGGARATLFACHPPGSVAKRIVVFASLSG